MTHFCCFLPLHSTSPPHPSGLPPKQEPTLHTPDPLPAMPDPLPAFHALNPSSLHLPSHLPPSPSYHLPCSPSHTCPLPPLLTPVPPAGTTARARTTHVCAHGAASCSCSTPATGLLTTAPSARRGEQGRGGAGEGKGIARMGQQGGEEGDQDDKRAGAG